MKTPLQELIYELTKSVNITEHEEYKQGLIFAIESIKTKLKKEQQIIMDANLEGFYCGQDFAKLGKGNYKDAKDYYNKRFK